MRKECPISFYLEKQKCRLFDSGNTLFPTSILAEMGRTVPWHLNHPPVKLK
jgi:hypothetical protein